MEIQCSLIDLYFTEGRSEVRIVFLKSSNDLSLFLNQTNEFGSTQIVMANYSTTIFTKVKTILTAAAWL